MNTSITQRIIPFVANGPIVIAGKSQRPHSISKLSHPSVRKKSHLFNLGTKQTQETFCDGPSLGMSNQNVDWNSALPTRPPPPFCSFHPNSTLLRRGITIGIGLNPSNWNNSFLLILLVTHHLALILSDICTSFTTDDHTSSKISESARRALYLRLWLLLLLNFLVAIASAILLLFLAAENGEK